jgi:hypothetical protein
VESKVGFSTISDILKNEIDSPDTENLVRFLNILSNTFPPFTIIVDEAQVYFYETVTNDDAKGILRMLTALSKEQRKLNVILSSSVFLFPYQLKVLEFYTKNIHPHMIMGDVPPIDVYSLLTKEWHIRPHLAIALINHFGGHILNLSQAVDGLALMGKMYRPLSTYGSTSSGDVSRCIGAGKRDSELKDLVIPGLKLLAESGFLPLEEDDKLGNFIAEYNVGGFVPKGAIASFLPDEVQRGRSGVVPSFQMMRMVIADKLVDGGHI